LTEKELLSPGNNLIDDGEISIFVSREGSLISTSINVLISSADASMITFSS